MIYRTVLAVVLATALVGAAVGPLTDARRDRASAVVADQLSGVERVARDLVATDDPTIGPGARRVATVRIPARRWASAAIDRVTIWPAGDGTPARFSWRISGGRERTMVLDGLRVRTPDGDALVLREPGRHRLVLALGGRPGSPVVAVRRLK